MFPRFCCASAALATLFACPSHLDSAPLISEFMAVNDSTLQDEDGDFSDWIEIHNPDATPVDLAGWHLTDDSADLTAWTFPAAVVPAGGYLVVFASNKNRAVAGSELHTNFRLTGGGEYLALVMPDGTTVTSSFDPYPQQLPDVAYGLGFAAQTSTVLAEGAAGDVLIPDATSGPAVGNAWRFPTYVEGSNGESWTAATSGVGFDLGGTFAHLVSAGGAIGPQMFNNNAGAYMRFDFNIADLAAVDAMTLKMRYDDGFVAFLNGEEVAISNAPGGGGGATTPYQDEVLADGPILYWTFDEPGNTDNAHSLVDDVPANELVAQGAATRAASTTTSGGASLGRAASFNGSSGTRFFAGDLARSDPPIDHYAVELWFRADSSSAQYLTEVKTEGGTSNTSSLIYGFSSGEFEIFSGDRSGTLVTTGAWHHLVIGHYGSAEPQFYVDGVLASNTAGGDFDSPWAFGMIGIGNAATANNTFDGLIDEFAIYDLTGLADTAARQAKVADIAAHASFTPPAANLSWDSTATSDRADSAALAAESFNLNSHIDELQAGTNVLAVHGLNTATNSFDFLVLPELEVSQLTADPGTVSYLTGPTPGEGNQPGSATVGPIISGVSAAPALPSDADDIVVTATVTQSFAPIGAVSLTYRVGFGSEVTLPMTASGPNTYTATIPASASGPGDMVRWKVGATDTGAVASVSPLFLDPTNSPEYHGTMVADPAVSTTLPVLYWFVQNPSAAETGTGTRASLFYNGEFYDNVFVRIRGATARSYVKKSFKFDFNRRDHFRFDPAERRVEEINVNTTYTDKSYTRTVMAYGAFGAVGQPTCASFPLRMQQNGAFFSVAIFVEQVDEDYLRRNGLDPEGALYKANLNTLGGGNELGAGTNGMDKKTRLHEDESDMQTLIDSVGLTGTALENYLFDNIDLPSVVNFMATSVVVQDIDRWATNFYVYRDSDGTGEWMFLPWDVDLTFGPNVLNTDTIVANQDGGNLRASHPLLGSEAFPYARTTLWNGLLNAVFTTPRTLEMFYRRLRSVSDQILVTQYFPDRIDALQADMAADVLLDRARWGGNAHFGNSDPSMQSVGTRIKNEYIVPRRTHLLVTHGGAGKVPASQPAAPTINFGAIEYNPSSGVQDQEYIELVNPNSFSVDLSGWVLSGGVDFTLRQGTVVPAGGSLYLSPDVTAFRARAVSPKGGEGRFVQGGYSGHISNFGETLTLRDGAGTLIAQTTTPVNPSDPQRYLVVSELMYHPFGNPGEEFVELLNISDSVTLDLTGVKFTAGVDFAFAGSAVTSLAPGARVLVVRDLAAFSAVHGGSLPVAGVFANTSVLNNDGERVKIEDATNSTVREFTYNDALPWPVSADGIGPSLVLIDPTSNPDHDDAANWRPSTTANGNPGSSDATTFAGDPVADLNSNGIQDLLDYVFGNGGALPESRPSVATGALDVGGSVDTYALLSYRRSLSADDTFEVVETSTDLSTWQSGGAFAVRVSSTDNGDGTTTELWRSANPVTPGRLFLRLGASRKP